MAPRAAPGSLSVHALARLLCCIAVLGVHWHCAALVIVEPASARGTTIAAQPAEFGFTLDSPALVGQLAQVGRMGCSDSEAKPSPAATRARHKAGQPAAAATNLKADPDFGSEPPAGRGGDSLQLRFEQWRGAIALVHRGDCTFHKKATRLKAAGAIGMVVINNQPEAPLFSMTDDSRGNDVSRSLPSVLVSMEDGEYLEELLARSPVSLTLSLACTSMYSDGVIHSCDPFAPSADV